ncbi:MAG: hypothetical protein P4L16_02610 [Chlamydiales bacterium]|nr:hypothetical protein [Chlamydiales bacterium]
MAGIVRELDRIHSLYDSGFLLLDIKGIQKKFVPDQWLDYLVQIIPCHMALEGGVVPKIFYLFKNIDFKNEGILIEEVILAGRIKEYSRSKISDVQIIADINAILKRVLSSQILFIYPEVYCEPEAFEEIVANLKSNKNLIFQVRERMGKQTSFYFACRQGRLSVINKLIEMAEEEGRIDWLFQLAQDGTTALHSASIYPHVDVMRLLIKLAKSKGQNEWLSLEVSKKTLADYRTKGVIFHLDLMFRLIAEEEGQGSTSEIPTSVERPISVDGSVINEAKQLVTQHILSQGIVQRCDWSPDGKDIIFKVECSPFPPSRIRFDSPLLEGETLIHQWIYGYQVFCLIRKIDGLDYIILNQLGEVKQRGPISFSEDVLITDELVEVLIEEMVPNFTISSKRDIQEGVSFMPPSFTSRSWSWEDKNVTVLEHDDELIWQLFDKARRTTSYAPFGVAFLSNNTFFERNYYVDRYTMAVRDRVDLSLGITGCKHEPREPKNFKSITTTVEGFHTALFREECSQQENIRIQKIYKALSHSPCPVSDFNALPSVSDYNRFFIEFLGNFSLEHVNTSVINHPLCSILLKPTLVASSKLDPTRPIDNNMWVVSLVNTDKKHWYGHAAIIIETMEEGQYCMYKAHLRLKDRPTKTIPLNTAPGLVEHIKIDSPDQFRCEERADTWHVRKSDVARMRSFIQEQIVLQEQGDVAVFFNARGSNAALVDAEREVGSSSRPVENCITWARGVLSQANIWLDDGGMLFTAPVEYRNGAKSYPKDLEDTSRCILL